MARWHPCLGVLDPAPEFLERHGVLIAHSLSYTGTEKAVIQILNPSVLIHQNEKVGHFQSSPTRKKTQANREVSKAIRQLVEGTECSTTVDRDKLCSLLQEFADVISTGDGDLGRTNFVHHKIDTGDATPS